MRRRFSLVISCRSRVQTWMALRVIFQRQTMLSVGLGGIGG